MIYPYSTFNGVAWGVLVFVIVLVIAISLLAWARWNGKASTTSSSCDGAVTPPTASIGFHDQDNSYTIALTPADTAKGIAKNATVISLVDTTLATDTNMIQYIKIIRSGVYVIQINSVFSTSIAPDTITMYIGLTIPSTTIPATAIPYSQVTTATTSERQSLSATYIVTLVADSTVTITMSSSAGSTVTIYGWDVNLWQLKLNS